MDFGFGLTFVLLVLVGAWHGRRPVRFWDWKALPLIGLLIAYVGLTEAGVVPKPSNFGMILVHSVAGGLAMLLGMGLAYAIRSMWPRKPEFNGNGN